MKPTEVVITQCDVTVEPAKKPPEATATLIVRVTESAIDKGTPGTVLTGVRVLLHKKNGTCLVQDADGEQIRLGQGSQSDRR